jgi:competence protein ComEC
LHRIEPIDTSINNLKSFEFANRKIILIDSDVSFNATVEKIEADMIVLSKNPKLYISNINKEFAIRQVVVDGSVPAWKAKLWKKDCDSLHIPYHDVSEKGAFVMKVQ